MGIYDRDYYRRDGSKFFGSLSTYGRITNAIIGINVVFFLFQMMGGPDQAFTRALDLNVVAVLHGQVWRLLTFAFLHSPNSIMHILFNMLLLFWFGRQVEERLGGREYLGVYLISAIASGVAFVGATLLGLHKETATAIGASGAVTAVLVLAAFYNPRQVILLFFILPVPIWGFVIISVAVDAFNLLGQSSGGTATSAHLGGAAFAFCYYKFGWHVAGRLRWPTTWKRAKSQARLKLYSEEEHEPIHARVSAPVSRPVAPAHGDDEQLEAQADAILEKIARVGMQGITESERALLVRASEMMKRRRS